MIDLLADAIKMDPAALRRKNFISEFPHQNHFGLTFDSGNYEKALAMALEMVGYEKLRQEQEDGRKKGRYLGIGLSSWIEICGFGPRPVGHHFGVNDRLDQAALPPGPSIARGPSVGR